MPETLTRKQKLVAIINATEGCEDLPFSQALRRIAITELAREEGVSVGGNRHPSAVARDKWRAAKADAFDPTTLGPMPGAVEYLGNRLDQAFMAGWDAAMEHAS